MGMTRSEFLRSLVAGAGAAITATSTLGAVLDTGDGAGPANHKGSKPLSKELSKAAFNKHINTKFRILDKESPTVIEAELVEVEAHGSSENIQQFSLLFKGPKEPLLPQKIYSIEHGGMGDFDLFIVPIAADETSASYEAVFSRLSGDADLKPDAGDIGKKVQS